MAAGLRSTLLLLVGVLVIASIASIATLVLVRNQLDEVAVRWAPLDRANDVLRETASSAQTALRSYLITDRPELQESFDSFRQSFGEDIDRAVALAGDEDAVVTSVENQAARFDAWLGAVADPAIALADADTDADNTDTLVLTTSDDAVDLFNQFADANAASEQLVDQRRSETRAQLYDVLGVMLVVVIVIVIAGLVAAWFRIRQLRRGLTGPLDDLYATLGRLGSGDLDARATVDGFAEVRAVVESVNALADENQRLSMRQSRRIEQERQGRRLAARLHEHIELTRILSLAGAAIGESLHVDRVVFHLDAEDGFGPPMLEWRAPGVAALSEGAARPLHRTHPLVEPIFDRGSASIADVDADGLDEEVRDALTASGTRSALAVPVLNGDIVVALVVVHEMVEPRSWLSSDVDLVQVIADELGSAIRHAQLYEAERGMVEQLRQLDEVKSDFVSSVSHELRTPLTSVMGYLEMLRDREAGPLTIEQDRMLDIVERNTERLLDLIEDLLALARIESGRFKVVPAPIELPPLLDATLDAIRPEIAKRELRLLLDVPPGLPLVLGDVRQLERVLLNLLSNAVKFTPKGGQVRVTLAPRVRSVVLEVADTGLGIPMEEQDKLFTRFFRSSVSQLHSVPGTGLGLMIVKAVVDSHGGTIDVRSAEGRGTAVIVSLPAVPASRPIETVHS